MTMNSRLPASRGFTLLEVMVALTITAFVLGGLFTLSAGSKRLAWSSQDSLRRSTEARAAINFAMLENDNDEVEAILEGNVFEIQGGEELEVPLRQTDTMTLGLQRYEVINTETDEPIAGSRWVRYDLAR